MIALYEDAIRQFRPREQHRSLDWFIEHVQTDQGRPYDHLAYPHIGAPGGPCDALDDPVIQSIYLQWGSRLGKTFLGQCATLKFAATDPCSMMFASQSEKLATEVVARTYRMFERCVPLRPHLLPQHKRKRSEIDFGHCRMPVAWARSVTTLADKPVKFGHGNEIDKWEHLSTSTEADPWKLFTDRGKEFPNRKFLGESTPTIHKRSRIERGRLSGSNCQYHVPCPHCKRYQVLRLGGKDAPGGIRWKKTKGGRSDPELARRTAFYECDHCHKAIPSDRRAWMMRRGVWVPEGCGVNDKEALKEHQRREKAKPGADVWRGWKHAKWITGKPLRDGRIASYQLSSLYSLMLDWGDVAHEFLQCKGKPQELRNFINQWMAETWELTASSHTWEEVGERLIIDEPYMQVPDWATLLTCGVDKQETHYVFVVIAWGPDRVGHVIDYGTCDTLEEIDTEVITRKYMREDDTYLKPHVTLVDSGFRPKGIYDFCRKMKRRGFHVFACKGSNQALRSEYKKTVLGKDTSSPGTTLVHVDTISTQDWIESMIHVLRPGDPASLSLFAASLEEHQDFLEQLINEAATSKLDSDNYERESWQRIDTDVPNDYRDCIRYAIVAMLLKTRRSKIPPRRPPGATTPTSPPRQSTRRQARPPARGLTGHRPLPKLPRVF